MFIFVTKILLKCINICLKLKTIDCFCFETHNLVIYEVYVYTVVLRKKLIEFSVFNRSIKLNYVSNKKKILVNLVQTCSV